MIEDKLNELGIILPIPPNPAGSYIPIVRSGNLVFVSGQIPIKDGRILYSGKVTKDLSIEDAQKAAQLCVINALANLKSEFGNLEKISKIIKLSGYVNSPPEFVEQPKVINGGSDLLFQIFEKKGQHARIAVGVSSLPLNSAVEIDLIVEVI
ncbi:MAG: RidA family protein [Nitrosopumilaceae archaeon]